ncbi:hypothetical protein [Klebsiella pneumoniae]|uniref:hypothetical protein n=1 Tax=Klebsiella pneumoniae TaxID=573 RepID=UPI0037BE5BA2
MREILISESAWEEMTCLFAPSLVKLGKGLTPGANIWYLKAALDHMIFNQMQEYFSPGYLRKMEQRSKKEFNQTYWWRPQDVTPQ